MDDEETLKAPVVQIKSPLTTTRSLKDGEPEDVFAEKLFAWQRERLERHLKGEYQSQIFRLNELVGGNLHAPLRVSDVRIEGALHTRPSFLASVLKPYLQAEPDSTLQNVLHQTRAITYALHSTQLFSSVVPELSTPQNPLASPADVDIVYRCKERSRLYLKSATNVGNGDADASATAILRNVFGGAEILEATAAFGMKTQHTYRLSLTAPLTGSLLTIGELSAYAIDNDYHSWASCKEALKGVKAGVTSYTWFGKHELSYQAVLRNIHGLKPDASMSIRQAAGPSFKSSISHTFTRDTRDDAIMGTSGTYFKFIQELAGFGGDTSFAKAEIETQLSRKLFNGLHVSFAARGGLLYPLDNKPTTFNDRFKLGGPQTVRAFKLNALGPREGGDSLGGDAYWAAGLSLIGDIPRKSHWPLKPHVYINVGKLAAVDRGRPLSHALRDAAVNPSISVGLGLIYRFDPIRVELNFGVPLVAYKTDGYQRGVQVGFGLECL